MTNPRDHVTAEEDRIPWGQTVAYGMGGVIPIALFNIAGQLIGLLGNISMGLSALWLGVVLMIPRLWDAVSDPIIGHWSDNTRSRWGRRRPYILVGGIAVAVSFVAMWWIPRGEAIEAFFGGKSGYDTFQFNFILIGVLIFFTSCTVFEIPHGALGMEMSADYHERTKLFSAKSFMGNLFAMGSPWLIALAGLEFFKGVGGDLTDGMRYVSLFIAAALIPLTIWWFYALKEPGFEVARHQEKTDFWHDMGTALSNTTFLTLVLTVFTLAMGFNFVSLFNYYITIFYLYQGDEVAAGKLLGLNGTVWAITGLGAVFPLNWISRAWGKKHTLLLAIGLMCAAQLSKIECYNPEQPYLILIPTVLLSSGMLMFFTLGSSMVGDICDEDELHTGSRSEGSYYSVYWWFIKLGTAFASVVSGALIVYTTFDEKQNVIVNSIQGSMEVLISEGEKWQEQNAAEEDRGQLFDKQLSTARSKGNELQEHLETSPADSVEQAGHHARILDDLETVRNQLDELEQDRYQLINNPAELENRATTILENTRKLKLQSTTSLFRLRLADIGVPLALSVFSIAMALRYPLSEARCYAIKEALKRRRSELETA